MKLQTIIASVLLLSALTANAAQQTINSTDTVGVQRGKVNTNFTELYTLVNGSPWLAQTTAPNIHNVFWIDTSGAPPTIKYWDGDSWEVAAASGDGTYTLPVASAEALGGVKIGERLTITDGVLSADVQTTDISGKQDILVSGTNIKTINGTSVLGLGNIVIDGGSINLATEQDWTAVQNFNAGMTATGLTLNLTSWTDWTFGGAQIVNASGTGDDEIWPASKVISELGGKQNSLGANAYQAYDADWLGITPNGASLVSAANYAAMRALLDLEVGTDFNAYDERLTTWAGITPGAGVPTFLGIPSGENLASALTTALPTTKGGTGLTALGTGVAMAMENAVGDIAGLSTTIASGTSVLGTGTIASGTCASAVTTTATNTAITDVINWGFNGDPTGVTGYAAATTGMLTIVAYPSAGAVNFKVCNNTAASITPGAITLDWRVIR